MLKLLRSYLAAKGQERVKTGSAYTPQPRQVAWAWLPERFMLLLPLLKVYSIIKMTKRFDYDTVRYALQGISHLCIPFLGIVWPLSQLPHSCVCERFIYSWDWSSYFSAAEYADQSWKYNNLSQIYECRDWETEHYNSVLEIKVLFLGIDKWEPDI
jgi:hypothetical protein